MEARRLEEGITIPQQSGARTKAKGDKRISKQIATLRAGRRRKGATARMRALAAPLGPGGQGGGEDPRYTDKTWAQFDTKNEELISDLKASRLAVKPFAQTIGSQDAPGRRRLGGGTGG